MVAQCENIGHPVRGIIVPNLHQYHHLGDAMTETDNLPYNPNLKPYESDENSSGTPYDRWAFTNRSSFLDYQTAASLAAASRALKGYNDDLAERSLVSAKRLLEEADEASKKSTNDASNPMSRFGRGMALNTFLQLYIITNDKKYATQFEDLLWPALERSLNFSISTALKAIPYMDEAFKNKLKDYVV